MAQSLILVENHDDVTVIRMNDPSTLNAASIEMVEELIEAMKKAERDSRAILFTGSERAFCTGAKLGANMDPHAEGYDAGELLDTHYNKLMLAIRALNVPIVTAVSGPAAGIGAALALAGDMVVAGQNAYFFQAFVKIGLVPDGGSASLLVHSVGRARAMELMMLGERLYAPKAYDWGLVNRLVEDGEVFDTALDLAKQLAAGPTEALGMIRKLGWQAMETGYEQMLSNERQMQKVAGQTADHREGINAFKEKRAPKFTGSSS